MEHNKKTGENIVSESSQGIETLKNETSATSSQEDDKDIVIKISHNHETVHNATSFPHLDYNRRCYAAQKEYY